MNNNFVRLKGCLGANPEVRTTQKGNPMMSFSLATNDNYKDDSGEWATSTHWHDVRVFCPATISLWEKTLAKGDRVLVEGRLEYALIEDKLGNKHKKSFIVVNSKGDVSRFDKVGNNNPESSTQQEEGGVDWVLDEDK